jgi:hypothetical protein
MVRVRFALPSPSSVAGAERVSRLIERLDDAVLPRLRLAVTPQIVVLFGATGCGKSVIANTLTRSTCLAVGAVRPTTRHPVLVACQTDIDALVSHPVRAMSTPAVASTARPGRVIVELPDLDLADRADRTASRRLLRLADLRIAVTSAARYGDAVGWEVLLNPDDAIRAHGLIVNRVAPRDADVIRTDLTERLDALPYDNPRAVIVQELSSHEPRLADDDGAHLDRWMAGLASGADSTGEVPGDWWRSTVDAIRADLKFLIDTVHRGADDAEVLSLALDEAWHSIKAAEAALLAARTAVPLRVSHPDKPAAPDADDPADEADADVAAGDAAHDGEPRPGSLSESDTLGEDSAPESTGAKTVSVGPAEPWPFAAESPVTGALRSGGRASESPAARGTRPPDPRIAGLPALVELSDVWARVRRAPLGQVADDPTCTDEPEWRQAAARAGTDLAASVTWCGEQLIDLVRTHARDRVRVAWDGATNPGGSDPADGIDRTALDDQLRSHQGTRTAADQVAVWLGDIDAAVVEHADTPALEGLARGVGRPGLGALAAAAALDCPGAGEFLVGVGGEAGASIVDAAYDALSGSLLMAARDVVDGARAVLEQAVLGDDLGPLLAGHVAHFAEEDE